VARAEFFDRNAVSVSQLLGGYDADAIDKVLEGADVGIAVTDPSAHSPEGQALLDLTVRLLARLYPALTLSVDTDDLLEELAELARSINPAIEIHTGRTARVAIAVGGAKHAAETCIYAGSSGWDALVSCLHPVPVGISGNPLGAGAAAAIACANVFRAVFKADDPKLDNDIRFSTFSLSPSEGDQDGWGDVDLGDKNVLVGAGAIGNAVLWSLARANVRGRLDIVDPEMVELSNLQRYVLARRTDVKRPKIDVTLDYLEGQLATVGHSTDWASFVATDHHWERAIVALDSARDRRAVQASLPRWIANAWTQPGDLGVSTHPWTEAGACLSCLYLPTGLAPAEDKLIAVALGLTSPEREFQIRGLLYNSQPPPSELLLEVAEKLDVDYALLEPYESRPLRDLYVEGVCGGAVVPLSRTGAPTADVHVPVAHQSALAGVLLAAAVLADAVGAPRSVTRVTRADLLRSLPAELTQPAQKDPRGICICQDVTYRRVYEGKYP
jgi:hypothetical protein